MKPSERESDTPSFWQLVFAQSKVNGALYLGEQLPGGSWDWPKNTLFQRRRRRVRWYEGSEKSQLNYLASSPLPVLSPSVRSSGRAAPLNDARSVAKGPTPKNLAFRFSVKVE